MKKRFFAGLLACLMVVGLLPLSMLLKPVSAKAASEIYKIESTDLDWLGKTASSVTNTYKSGDFTFEILKNAAKYTGKYDCKDTAYTSSVGLKFGGGINKDDEKNAIKFKVNSKAKVRIWWRSNGNYIQCISSSGKEEDSWKATNKTTKSTSYYDEISVKPGEYYVGSAKSSIYIYKIEVEPEEEAATSYKVTINDGTESKTETVKESAEYKITAKGANFLYWVNSYGRIVSREAEYSFPVYYSDTYTAVYKSADTTYNFMTDYDQVYKTYTASDLAIPTSPVKYGYEFNYWKIGETKVSTIEEIKAAGADTDVVIKPVYKEITENVSITINGVSKEYKKNEVVTADATALENFMYWHVTGDESKILSYNDLYSFYADDKISSITAKCGTDTVEKSGIITHVTNYSNGNSKTFVFEFTVPEGYTIEFAGVVVSSTSTEPTLTDYEYIRGRSSSAQTYRYSWTKLNAGNTTWNVRPILKYSDGQGNIMTIDTSTVQSL
jgi:hypothetical protein